MIFLYINKNTVTTYDAYFSFLLDFPCPTVHILKPKKGALTSGPLLELLHLQTLHIEILYFLFSFIFQILSFCYVPWTTQNAKDVVVDGADMALDSRVTSSPLVPLHRLVKGASFQQ